MPGHSARRPGSASSDLEAGRQIMRLLLTVVRSEGITALVATHDEALMDLADEVIRLEDGHVAAGPEPLRP
jgi:putative ABC transport system ATP-binding protein